MKRHPFLWILVILLAACQAVEPTLMPVTQPFPTMTAGQRLIGVLPTPVILPGIGRDPAAQVAEINQPTATPDSADCPLTTETELEPEPDNRADATTAILRYLSRGGSVENLEDNLRDDWQALGETGFIRSDADLTGEGIPEIVLGFIAPGDVGTLLIAGCVDGRYISLYETINDGSAPPQIVSMGDLNRDARSELVMAGRRCQTAETCLSETLVLSWDTARRTFDNLLDVSLNSAEPPEVRDTDADGVLELVVALTSRGTAATGPLRTGVLIYDWDGTGYTLSVRQLDPPRYKIQVIHAADDAFSRLQIEEAAALYELALSDEDLRYWFNDGPQTVDSYIYYRLVLAYAYLGDLRLAETLARMDAAFPITEETPLEDQPVYIELALRFMDTLQSRNDLNAACNSVQEFLPLRPQALTLMNRYGDNSPTYSALELCPY